MTPEKNPYRADNLKPVLRKQKQAADLCFYRFFL